MPSLHAETIRTIVRQCGQCKNDFSALVATWVDVSRTPQVKTQVLRWEFNVVTCPVCGNRQYADSAFFYEDFAEGLLVAVFTDIPKNRLSLEERIKRTYGYYPTLDFFYDMTQLWFLIYLQEHYGKERGPDGAILGTGRKRLQRFLHFLKRDPLMLTMRQTLTEVFSGSKTNDDLQDVVWRALAKIEGGRKNYRRERGAAR